MSSLSNATVFRAVNGRPAENLEKVVALMGGIDQLIGADDVVVLKPNVQWWNQGAPNLSVLKTFVDLVMSRPGGFHGEVVMAENCHRGIHPWESMESGWSRRFVRNSDLDGVFSFNELGELLKREYGDRFTVCHWINVKAGGRRVYGPQDGPGYVYCDGTGGVPLLSMDNGLAGPDRREVMMTYPVFQTDCGTMVDFRNGIWADGQYIDQPLKFINCPAFNHHSIYCGATGAIKNYMGISDLSGGPDSQEDGRLTEHYYNFHTFPFNHWAKGPVPGMLGAEVGMFLDTIRKADLNLMSAEWIGLVSRTELPCVHARAVLASADPVALDVHAAKYLLYPNSGIPLHNPEDPDGPLYQYLKACAQRSGYVFNAAEVAVRSYDCRTQAEQTAGEWTVKRTIRWGVNPKMTAKYLVLRFLQERQEQIAAGLRRP